MGNNLTITLEEKKQIFNTLAIKYELLKSKKVRDELLFKIMLKKYNDLINNTYYISQKTKQIQTLDLFDIDLSGVDGVIKTDTYTLIGWKDGNEELDLDGLDEILEKNDKNGDN